MAGTMPSKACLHRKIFDEIYVSELKNSKRLFARRGPAFDGRSWLGPELLHGRWCINWRFRYWFRRQHNNRRLRFNDCDRWRGFNNGRCGHDLINRIDRNNAHKTATLNLHVTAGPQACFGMTIARTRDCGHVPICVAGMIVISVAISRTGIAGNQAISVLIGHVM